MPCYSVIYNQVNLGAFDAELLGAALAALGAEYISIAGTWAQFKLSGNWYLIEGGVLKYPEGSKNIADDIKRGVGVAALYRDAKKGGFKVRKVTETKYQVIRGAR